MPSSKAWQISKRSKGSRCRGGKFESRITADSRTGNDGTSRSFRAAANNSPIGRAVGNFPSWCLTSNSQMETGLMVTSLARSEKTSAARFESWEDPVAIHQKAAVSSNNFKRACPQKAEEYRRATARKMMAVIPGAARAPNQWGEHADDCSLADDMRERWTRVLRQQAPADR